VTCDFQERQEIASLRAQLGQLQQRDQQKQVVQNELTQLREDVARRVCVRVFMCMGLGFRV
jgi:cell shape-determining protein MreC